MTSGIRVVLTLLALLFLARVLGQSLARGFELPFLPPDSLWHAGTVAYPVLAAVQIVILAVMAIAICRLEQPAPHPRLARLALALGAIYLGAMSARFVIGASGLADGGWFDQPISTAFHLVLAAWLLVFAAHLAEPGLRLRLRRALRRWARPLAYPLVVAAACLSYAWLRRHDAPVPFAAYLPVTLAASAILTLELATPYRRAWRPDRRSVAQDALYLLVVQIALPAALTLAVAKVSADALNGSVAAGLWPDHWPVAAQAALMILAADFLRYWLHRAAHRWPPLWRLHAVHHAPEALYFLNVGRFHPLEKSLQFLVDAAPFILIGVAPEVVAAYFVFYAVNGFFQHSNVELRLGPLNWLVAGPELHRWHHSRVVRESEHNFGNNLIVWDLLFATRFLPERQVGALGLRNRSYPKDFLGQTLAPVTVDPNRGPEGARAA